MPEGSGPYDPVRRSLTLRADCFSERTDLVLAPGLEPGRHMATDFKSVMSTYSIMRALLACPRGFEPLT